MNLERLTTFLGGAVLNDFCQVRLTWEMWHSPSTLDCPPVFIQSKQTPSSRQKMSSSPFRSSIFQSISEGQQKLPHFREYLSLEKFDADVAISNGVLRSNDSSYIDRPCMIRLRRYSGAAFLDPSQEPCWTIESGFITAFYRSNISSYLLTLNSPSISLAALGFGPEILAYVRSTYAVPHERMARQTRQVNKWTGLGLQNPPRNS